MKMQEHKSGFCYYHGIKVCCKVIILLFFFQNILPLFSSLLNTSEEYKNAYSSPNMSCFAHVLFKMSIPLYTF